MVTAVQGGRHHPLPGLSGRKGAGGREAEPDPLLHPPGGHARGKGEVWGEMDRIGDWIDSFVRFCRIGFSSESKPLRNAEFTAVLERLFSLKTLKTLFAGRWSRGCYFAVRFDFSHLPCLGALVVEVAEGFCRCFDVIPPTVCKLPA